MLVSSTQNASDTSVGAQLSEDGLLGRHFVLHTGHSALQWIYSMNEPEGQMAPWLEQLQVHDFEVVHRKGHGHLNEDALSHVCVSSHGMHMHGS